MRCKASDIKPFKVATEENAAARPETDLQLMLKLSPDVLSKAISLTVPAVRQVIPRGNLVGWSHVHIVSK